MNRTSKRAPLEAFEDSYFGRFDRDAEARYIGFTDTGFPEELAVAAGFVPILVRGAVEERRLEYGEHFDLRMQWTVQDVLDSILRGEYNFIDVLCVTGGDLWFGYVQGIVEGERLLNDRGDLPRTYYLDRTRDTTPRHRNYYRDRLREFRAFLEEATAARITGDAIAKACVASNRCRRLLADISALQCADVPTVTGREALLAGVASMTLDKNTFADLATAFVAERSERTGSPAGGGSRGKRPRIFLSGTSNVYLDIYDPIERAGGHVVGTDYAVGRNYSGPLIANEGDPVDAIVERYAAKPLDSWMLGMDRRVERRLDLVKQTRAEAVITLHYRNDQITAWEHPDTVAALDEMGVPHLTLWDLDNGAWSGDALPEEVRVFISGVTRAM